jgi:3-methyl-2-oxobutanoate hydroxymethyltransferase
MKKTADLSIKNIYDFKRMQIAKHKITMVTCYDYWSAKIISESNIDCILVGDSAAMVMHGYPDTIGATVEMMCMHIQAVRRGAPNKFIIGDMPFLSYRKGLKSTMETVEQFMRCGANAIKLEGCGGNEKLIAHIVESGIPVMGHLGLTPQAVNQLGGFVVQGRNSAAAEQMMREASWLEKAGCFALVLECIPQNLARSITQQLSIPTIGIGAGKYVAGQVLVLQDLLGMQKDFKPKFLKTYGDGFNFVRKALNGFADDVKAQKFPSKKHCYTSIS